MRPSYNIYIWVFFGGLVLKFVLLSLSSFKLVHGLNSLVIFAVLALFIGVPFVGALGGIVPRFFSAHVEGNEETSTLVSPANGNLVLLHVLLRSRVVGVVMMSSSHFGVFGFDVVCFHLDDSSHQLEGC